MGFRILAAPLSHLQSTNLPNTPTNAKPLVAQVTHSHPATLDDAEDEWYPDHASKPFLLIKNNYTFSIAPTLYYQPNIHLYFLHVLSHKA
jgi:hypothetical protein